MNRIVLFRDKEDEDNETQYGILVEDDLNGNYILCLCCFGLYEFRDCEIIEDYVELTEDLSVLVGRYRTKKGE